MTIFLSMCKMVSLIWASWVKTLLSKVGHKWTSSKDSIRAETVNEDNEITLRLKPGLRYEDYVAAWKALSATLGPSRRLAKPYTNVSTSSKIYEASLKGLSYGEIAKQFYPAMDKILARDRVIKIIGRERRRRESGTNLAK